MTGKRDLERELEELADGLADHSTDDGDPPTKAELGVTAGFVRFDGDDPPEIPEGWTWEREEDATNGGADLNVAVREESDE
ncbi:MULTISPECIES: hypothetical protein [Halolamina]|uniref:Uncharacterized protein n=2 Tax=Halolamina TaxID=1075397 RepID=A0A1I5WCJ5_9EURY|nr:MULTISPECIES: hypothetical protein [Halolamina]NHX37991.1 hypothetical protein [Halolamina sp. R1-12]SFQ17385.1 hypothetical protein SAMN05216277_1277 [Halolamina pelagica]